MNQERIALGKVAQLFAHRAADVNPVLWRYFHEIDLARRNVLELAGQRPAQPKARATNRVI